MGFVTLIGSNGAGKSTTLRAISGLERISSGEIHYDGKRIDALEADAIVRLGIAQVPEGGRVFKDLSVEGNLRLGAFTRDRDDLVERDFDSVMNRFLACANAEIGSAGR